MNTFFVIIAVTSFSVFIFLLVRDVVSKQLKRTEREIKELEKRKEWLRSLISNIERNQNYV